ncbi:MAG TPA: sugar phosphate isomerase/epimerase family protein [Bryobacteraceae bacterium]|nr:sugar phosphate isomerase/epimerase family protein [Bryobacteraceae bacterium]
MNISRRDVLKATVAATAAPHLDAAGADPAHGFNLGIISDELTTNLDEALTFIADHGLHWCELREIWGKNLMNSPQEDLDRAKKVLAEKNVRVSEIASPIFKWNLPRMPALPNEQRDEFKAKFTEEDADTLLEKAFRLAHFFGTQKVRIFTYWRVEDPEKAYPQVRERLEKAAQLAGRNGIVLTVENEHSCNVGTGRELGRLLKDVNSPHLRGVWDPGNAVMLGETPYPDGYEAVRGLFPHMHVKDVRKNATTGKNEWAPVGGGVIDFKGQFRALRKDHYRGTLSLETHYLRPDKNKVESTRESLEGLFKVLGETA